jgi:hypothetical protein
MTVGLSHFTRRGLLSLTWGALIGRFVGGVTTLPGGLRIS